MLVINDNIEEFSIITSLLMFFSSPFRIPRSVQFSRLLEKDQEKHTRGLKKNSSKPNENTSNFYNNYMISPPPPLLVLILLLQLTVSTNIGSAHSYDVFLGGSCNPTTWRKDLAVPYLQEAGLSFYNPVRIFFSSPL